MSSGQNPQWQPPGGAGWQQQPPSGQSWPPSQTFILPTNDPDLKSRVTNWMFGQPAIVVLLFIGVGMFGWTGWYVITKGIPAHLTQIQSGYETINTANNLANAERDKRHADDLTAVRAESARREALLREILKTQPEEVGEKAAAAMAEPPDKRKPGT